MKVYIGWDQRDALAYEVCVQSLLDNASIDVEVIPILEWKLRANEIYWRSYHVCDGRSGDFANGQMVDAVDWKNFSTNFSFTRFAVPIIEDYQDEWVMFMDADMLWRSDIAKLIGLIDKDKAIMCVQHKHEPPESVKMDNVIQSLYQRKNWSSVFLLNPSKCRNLTKYALNNQTGSWLHGMNWVDDDMIGGIPSSWNWLCGWSDPKIEPDIVHYTRGTPDMAGYGDEPYADEWREVRKRVAPAALFNGWGQVAP